MTVAMVTRSIRNDINLHFSFSRRYKPPGQYWSAEQMWHALSSSYCPGGQLKRLSWSAPSGRRFVGVIYIYMLLITRRTTVSVTKMIRKTKNKPILRRIAGMPERGIQDLLWKVHDFEAMFLQFAMKVTDRGERRELHVRPAQAQKFQPIGTVVEEAFAQDAAGPPPREVFIYG